ncbi:MAG: hypothetical protein ACRECA_05045 [Pseudolabrys sp.]
MKFALTISTLLLAVGGNSFAAATRLAVPAPNNSTSLSSDYAPTYYEPVLIYFALLTQTTDTSTPVDVNDLNLNTDLDDDDLNVFYNLLIDSL